MVLQPFWLLKLITLLLRYIVFFGVHLGGFTVTTAWLSSVTLALTSADRWLCQRSSTSYVVVSHTVCALVGAVVGSFCTALALSPKFRWWVRASILYFVDSDGRPEPAHRVQTSNTGGVASGLLDGDLHRRNLVSKQLRESVDSLQPSPFVSKREQTRSAGARRLADY